MIRVLIVDDEALVRSGLRLILSAAEDILVVAEAADGAAAVAAVRRHRPDVVLMDVRMPGTDGLTAAEQLRALPARPHVIMLTTFDEDEYVHRALRAGAVGFLLKDTPPTELAGAVRTVAAGNAMLAPTVTRRLLDTFDDRYAGPAVAASARLDVLTDREREVADEVAEGRSNAEIARRLGTTEATVKTHVSRILAKLGLDNRVQAAILVRDAAHR
ncbi:DNA-binding response regulator [Actinocatenispora thailandica]|uniref:DNA-binding response regulator n=1 Tax=Actinocatenispora thailandica TaxID=227318 RepID=A0A7R7I000_9ACTN|nr:response regulator transcription factor [Actinocatenispora thailandica]BCJ37553.1 DNA-binding response regulator [Actinocatenispora thailandica]